MDRAYDPQLVKLAKEVAKEVDMENEVQTGVYICVGGPNFETIAELRMLKLFGVDAVGMSTVSVFADFFMIIYLRLRSCADVRNLFVHFFYAYQSIKYDKSNFSRIFTSG